MGATQQFSLKWNNYGQHITCAFENLRTEEDLVDVTLSCEGKKIYAHKMLLSACSNYFRDVFRDNPCKHPVIIFRNVSYDDLLAIVDFMYHGEVNVEQNQLSSFLTTAEMLAVQGLSVGSTAPKEEVPKRHPVLVESLTQTPHERTPPTPKQFTTKVGSRPPMQVRNPRANHSPSQVPRPVSPVNLKRKYYAPPRTEDLDAANVKKLLKGEREDVEEEVDGEAIAYSATGEDDMMDVSELAAMAKDDSQSATSVKDESPSPEEGTEKAVIGVEFQKSVGQAGSSSNVDGAGDLIAFRNNEKSQWRCEVCGKAFKHKDSRRQHYKSHEGSTECPICHNVLSRKYELKVHMKKRHNIDIFKKDFEDFWLKKRIEHQESHVDKIAYPVPTSQD